MPRQEQGNGYAVPPALTVLSGPGTLRGVLDSPTTRTIGLISFTDLSASLIRRFRVDAAATGHSVRIVTCPDPMARVRVLNQVAKSNIEAMVPVLLACGMGLAGAVVLGLAALAGAERYGSLALCLLRTVMTLPLAFLVVGPVLERLPSPIAWTKYAVLVAGAAALWALLVGLCGRLLSSSADADRQAAVLLTITSLVIAGDGLVGQPLIRSSLLAGCGLSGIRYYGVGNEYMAILIGCLLGILFLLGLRPSHAHVFGALAMLFFGLGTVGANGGGVITACAGFGFAAILMRGRPVERLRYAMLLPLLGLALAFLFAVADAHLYGQGSSHLGGALQAAHATGVAELKDIAVRKLLMNVGILTSQPVLVVLAVVAVVVSVAAKRIRQEVQRLSDQFKSWLQWLPAAVYTGAVAFLFNDTGVVAALFIIGVWAIVGLFLMLETRFGRSSQARLVE